MQAQLHAFEAYSRSNGPGTRAVVWFQGCTLGCPGCFNPTTHDPEGGSQHDTVLLAERIRGLGDTIDGISISGGEPFQQPEALLDLLQRLQPMNLSCLVFSGHTLEEIRQITLGPAILEHIDVLFAGRYLHQEHQTAGLLGSANQKVHLLTRRHTIPEFQQVPDMEAIIHADGTITMSGIRTNIQLERRIGTH